MILVQNISKGLLIAPVFILKVANSASHRYKSYEIPKRRGATRTIYHPSKDLKAIQRWLLHNIVNKFPVHAAAMAYRRGLKHPIIENAMKHKDNTYLLRMDCKDFFPSITRDDITRFFAAHLSLLLPGWEGDDTELFCKLVCRHGSLTIGSPTSPGLANALCHDLDAQLTGLAFSRGVQYTRYADDFFFSTNTPDVLRGIEAEVLKLPQGLHWPLSLAINEKKTIHSSRRSRRMVTGVVLTPQGVLSPGHALKRRVRAMIHQFNSLDETNRKRLAGLLNHCFAVEPDFLNRLILKYGAASVRKARTAEP